MGKGFEDSNDHAQPLRPPDRPIRYPEVARMPSNTNDEESNSDEEANIPKTTLHRTEGRVSTTTIPGAVAVDGINRQQRQQSGAYTADDDDDDTLIIQSADDDEIIYQNGAAIPPNLLLQESALQHSVVATLATDDDLSVRVANRVEEKVTKRLKELMDARLSQQQQEEQFCRSQIVAAETVTIEPDNNGEEGKTTSANASGFGWASSSNTTNPFHYDNFKICGVRRRCWGILFSILGLFMLGATIGTYFHFSNQPRPKALTPNTISPTPFPTSLNLWDDLIQLIGDTIVGERGEAAWEDPTTPQYAALSWMARDDLYTIRVLEKESTQNQHNLLVERYALTVLYFASNGPSSWKLSLDFLEPTDVCDWNIGGHSRSGTQQEGAAITTTIMGVYCNNATGSVDSPEIAAMSSVSFLHMGTCIFNYHPFIFSNFQLF